MDEQFKQFAEQFEKFKEMLIRIDENTKNHGNQLFTHSNEDAAKFALTDRSLTKVHDRIDKLKENSSSDLNQLREKVQTEIELVKDEIKKYKNLFRGGILSATFIISTVTFLTNIYCQFRIEEKMKARYKVEDTLRNS